MAISFLTILTLRYHRSSYTPSDGVITAAPISTAVTRHDSIVVKVSCMDAVNYLGTESICLVD